MSTYLGIRSPHLLLMFAVLLCTCASSLAAPPTFVAAGTVASGTGTITPALPSGRQTNDILLLFVETANQACSITNPNGGTWTQVTGSPQGTGTAGGTSATRLTVFWSRYNGTQGAPTVGDSGDHQLGRILAIRGAVTSGDPWDVTAGGIETTSDTSGSIPGATTTLADTLVVTAIATSLPDASSTAKFSGWTNANLTSLTERTDNTVTAGNGGGLAMATGLKASAGAHGNTAVTLVNAAVKGMMSIAIKAPGDTTAPAAVSNLATSSPTGNSITLTWTAPGDDGSTGTAASYDIRYGTSAINDANWASATQVTGEPAPALAGTNQNMVVSGLSASTTYYFAMKTSDEVPNTSAISNVPSDTTSGGALPAPWQRVDIGTSGGTASYSSPTFTIEGSGWDIWSTSDGFCYVYQSLSGDGTIIARVVSVENTHWYAKAGVMIRETLDGGSKNAAVVVTPSSGTGFQWRAATNDLTSNIELLISPPRYVKLERSGNNFTAYESTDGSSWSQLGTTQSISMATDVYVGMCVSAHDAALCTGTFDNVGVTSGGDTTAPAAVSNLATSSPTSSSITLTWTAPGDDGSTGTAASYDIRYSTSTINEGNWASATQVTGEPAPAAAGTNQSMTVSGLSASTTYYFALKTSDEVPNTSAISNCPSGTTSSDGGLPSPWQRVDIGTSGGTASYSSPTFTIEGSGWDIWSTSDGFCYVYQSLSGNGTIIARVVSVENTHWWAKAGVMIRETLDGGSRNAAVVVSPTSGMAFQWRAATNDPTYNAELFVGAPRFVKLERSGNNFTAYESTDGDTWSQLGTTQSITMASNVYVGMCVSAHVYDSTLCTGTFDSVSVTSGGGDTTAPAAVGNLATSGLTSGSITLSWTAPGDDGSTGTAASYDIRYSTSTINEGNWASATQVTGEPAPAAAGTNQNMIVGGLLPSTTYYFALKTSDEMPNTSAISNCPSGTTTSGGGTNGATFVTQSVPTSMAAGQNYAVSVTMHNSGTSTWTAAAGYNLGSRNPYDNTTWGMSRVLLGGGDSIAPGQDKTFNWTVTAPTTAGTYDFQWAMVLEGVEWFGDLTPNVVVTVSGGGSDTTAPAAVSNLATSNPTSSSITLTWTAPGDDGNTGTAASYDIRYRTGGAVNDSNWASATQVTGEPAPVAAGNNQSMIVTGLSASTTYYFAIKTSDEVPNTSLISNSPSVTTLPPGPATIIALKRHAGLLAGGEIDARFNNANVVTGTVQDSAIWDAQSSRWYNGGVTSNTSDGVSYVLYKFNLAAIPDLNCATINLAQLRFYHSSGNGFSSMGGVAKVLTHDWIEGSTHWSYPGAAGGVSWAHPIGYNTNNEQNASGGSEPPHQSWGYNSDSMFDMNIDAGPMTDPFSAPTGAGFNVINVTSDVQAWARGSYPNYGWFQKAGAWNFQLSDAGSDYEPVLFIDYSRTGDITPPAAVSNLAAGSPTSSSLVVTWTAPGDDGSTGTATSYDLRYSTSPITTSGWGAAIQVTGEPTPAAPGTSQNKVVTGLAANTTYYFAIKTADEMTNTSALSNIPTAQTLADVTAPAAVSNLATSSPTSSSITLSWTAPGDDGSTGTAASYDIRYSTSTINAGNWGSATQVLGEPTPAAAGTNQNMVVTGLVHNTTYYFAMKTADEIPNTSGLSNVVAGQTPPDVTAPAAVTNLAITKPKSTTLMVTWTAPGDDGSTGTAASYDVRYSTSPINAGNWASATPATGEPVPTVAGTSQRVTIRNLTPQTTYYVALKTSDEVPNASALSNVPSGQTTDTSPINRPVLYQDDFQYLGAFLLPYAPCGASSAFNGTGLAIRKVGGQLRFITGASRTSGDAIYEISFPGWGNQWGTWPQASITNEWGLAIYGNPNIKYANGGDVMWTHGLLYDDATNRLYFSWGPCYNTAGTNFPGLAYAVLDPGGPITYGPWVGPQEANNHRIRGGTLKIPAWFADGYVGGRTLGLGFGGPYSGNHSCSQGQFLAAAYAPTPGTPQLDVVRLIDHPSDGTNMERWATRDPDYWGGWTPSPVNGVGYWTYMDTIYGASVWIDLPDKHGLLYAAQMAHEEVWYRFGLAGCDARDNEWWMYDPSDLVPVAQGLKQPWETQRDDWHVVYYPPEYAGSCETFGCAFDPETRTLYIVTSGAYHYGVEWYPLIHGWHIN